MGLRKGQTNNPNGRPKGKPNKLTTDIKFFFKNILEKNRAQIERDLRDVDPATRLRFICALFPYVMPKLQAVEVTKPNDEEKVKNLTDEEIKKEIERIRKSLDE